MDKLRISELIEATGGRLITNKSGLVITRVSIDSRAIKPGELFIALKGKRFDGHNFVPEAVYKGAAAVMVSREVELPANRSVAVIAVEDTHGALLKLAGWYRNRLRAQVIAITGSNGKTTTKEMLAGLVKTRFCVTKAKASYNNDIGVPLTILEMEAKTEVGILEIEMNEIGGTMRLAQLCQPIMGIVTNVGDTHLEFMKDRLGVAQEKRELIESLPQSGVAILNYDDPLVLNMKPQNCRFRTFGLNRKADVFAGEVRSYGINGTEFCLQGEHPVHLSFPGRHNIYNFLAAAAAAHELGLEWTEIAQNAISLCLPPQRLTIKRLTGVVLIDDSFNANPQSLEAALEVLTESAPQEHRLAVLGDMLELGTRSDEFHRKLGERVGRVVGRLVTVGQQANLIAAGAKAVGSPMLQVRNYPSAADVGDELFDMIKPNDIILVKGSRAMRLENLTQKIVRHYGEKKDQIY